MKRTLTAIALLCLAGCSMFDPGGQTRQALLQKSMYGWNESQFTAEFLGSQEAAFRMYEGEIVLKEDGTIDIAASVITAVLISEPSAKVAGDLAPSAFNMSVQHGQNIRGIVGDILTAVAPAIKAAAERSSQPAPEETVEP